MGAHPSKETPLQKYLIETSAKYAKTNVSIFRFCLTILDFLLFLKIFCTGFKTNDMEQYSIHLIFP